MFFSSSDEKACKKFKYQGCEGNSNNFGSEEICKYTCFKEITKPPSK